MEIHLRRRAKIRRVIIIGGGALAALLVAYFALNAIVRPGMIAYASVRVDALATDAIYASMGKLMAAENDGEPYVSVLQSEKQVYYIEMNNRALNRLAANMASEVQTYINGLGAQGIDIPLGTASGIPMLAGRGPNIRMKFAMEGTAEIGYSSEFHSAGINQTLHRVHMVARTNIAFVLPGYAGVITTRGDMTVAEHVIVGEVPDGYVNGSMDGILNLTPGN
ncbi:MAG: sporulation protein YunB [Clostridiales bacterium]|jgi:sporulation protein YunB|nr:sporulation protein YunB [Clostridiales bacterium]